MDLLAQPVGALTPEERVVLRDVLHRPIEASRAEYPELSYAEHLAAAFAYRRIKNFACVEVHPSSGDLLVYVKVNPDSLELVPGFTRDVRNIGHFGTGDLEIKLRSKADLDRALPLLQASYDNS